MSRDLRAHHQGSRPRPPDRGARDPRWRAIRWLERCQARLTVLHHRHLAEGSAWATQSADELDACETTIRILSAEAEDEARDQ